MNTYSNIARHGASRCVTLFSDNVFNLSRVFGLRVTVRHGSSRFVTLRHGLSRLKYPTNLRILQLCFFTTAIVPKKQFHQRRFFRQTWPLFPTNIVHSDNVSKFWEHWKCIQILDTLLFLAYFKTRILRDLYSL